MHVEDMSKGLQLAALALAARHYETGAQFMYINNLVLVSAQI